MPKLQRTTDKNNVKGLLEETGTGQKYGTSQDQATPSSRQAHDDTITEFLKNVQA